MPVESTIRLHQKIVALSTGKCLPHVLREPFRNQMDATLPESARSIMNVHVIINTDRATYNAWSKKTVRTGSGLRSFFPKARARGHFLRIKMEAKGNPLILWFKGSSLEKPKHVDFLGVCRLIGNGHDECKSEKIIK